ncbi:MAG: UDP-N-acetylmuramate--L-alanine ligase [Lachnospiraceae bacterium]|nr:UDP-N-acetylmuramate--L-alanine ligase [Lachnospiraceae bacterium]
MYNIQFNQPCHVHFMGIGGISMSGLAEILLNAGFTISGSDQNASSITEHLTSLGASIHIGQCKENINDSIDLVVYTAAISKENEEYVAALEKQIPMLSRAELLGQLMTNYDTPIAISGTHGKTTTTSMLTHILLAADSDPTISVGGILKAIGGNIRVGKSPLFVTEACEYTNSFLSFFPKISVILNVEEDHLDFFSGIEEITESFHQFAGKLPKDGLLVINGDIPTKDAILKGLDCRVKTYGTSKENDYYPSNITYDETGNSSFDLFSGEESEGHYTLKVAGEHNIYNAISAIIIAKELGITNQQINEGFSTFYGTNRRFEYKGDLCGVHVIDDYAHHPTEIQATLDAATRYPHNELWCVFQPHTYSRTKAFLDDFAKTLSQADHVVLADIYAAREVDTGEISSKDLAEKIAAYGTDVHYFPSFDEIENFLLTNCKKNDLLITMGAGNVVNIGESLLNL